MSEPTPRQALYDRLGVLVSTTCAIHCALVPVLILALPAAGVALGDERLEWSLLALAGIIASWSLLRGYRRHRSRRVLVVLVSGLLLLVLARGVELWSDQVVAAALVSLAGAAFLVYGHMHNLRLSRAQVAPSSA